MADHTMLLTSGRILGYAEHGDPEGMPLFFFHGWPSARVQGLLLDEMGKRKRLRIISPDRPGIGLSEFQPDRKLLDWPQTLSELAAHLDFERFHVMGWSGGGPYVLATALRMPERLLSASVVCGAPPLSMLGIENLFWPYRAMIRLRKRFPALLHFILNVGERASRGEVSKPPMSWLTGMLAEPDRRVLVDPLVFKAVRGGMTEALRRGPAMVIADADIYLAEWGFSVDQITYPVTFWHGKEDRNIGWEYSAKLVSQMPNAAGHWIEGEGHYSLPVLQAEAILSEALRQ